MFLFNPMTARASQPASAPDDSRERQRAAAIEGPALAAAVAIEHMAFDGKFGVELEMLNITLTRMREVVAAYFGPHARTVEGGVLDPHGRLWEVKPDLYDISELATPPLRGREDLRLLQGLAKRLQAVGATCSVDTGVHVHIDAKGLTEKQIVRLLGLVSRHEADLMSALKIHPTRLFYCGDARRTALLPMLTDVPESRPALMRAYRGYKSVKCLGTNVEHLAPSQIGTLEFRYFNGTLNPSIIGCNVGLAMALGRFARSDGPLPSADSLQDAGGLAGLLQALDLPPSDPASIYLYRTQAGLRMPPADAEPLPQMRVPRRDIPGFKKMGVRREDVLEILGTLAPPERRALAAAAAKYISRASLVTLHARELLALSRMTAETMQQVVDAHSEALATLPTAVARAEALGWLAENSGHASELDAAFETLPLAYKIAAPGDRALPLLQQLRAFGVPLLTKSFSAAAFQRLAYMDADTQALHLRTWQSFAGSDREPRDIKLALDYVLTCLDRVDTADAGTLVRDLQAMGVTLDARIITPHAFHALSAMPDAPACLRLWRTYASKWCKSSWDEQRLLDDMVDKPLRLLAEQLRFVDGLPRRSAGYAPLRARMAAIDSVSADHLHAIGSAIAHVLPHLQDPAQSAGDLAQSFVRLRPALLRAFAARPLVMPKVGAEDEVYTVFLLASGKTEP